MRFRFIREHRKTYRVRRMCAVLDVSPAGFYAWMRRAPSPSSLQDDELRKEIDAIFTESREIYGSPRIHAVLRSRGVECGRKRVARLMRERGLRSRVRRRFKATTTNSRHALPVAPNLLDRQFSRVTESNQAWLADITYIPTGEGFLYLAAILDLSSRRALGLAMSSTLRTLVAVEALVQALGRCGNRNATLHHSDRGVQYASKEYQTMLVESGIVCSMSRKGDCYDNAVMESFFHTLKTELIHGRSFETRDEARASVFEYIEVFYNRQRIHSSLGYKTPDQVFNERSVS